MADRFPLIANSSSNQIQELASGDTLDLTGNMIDNAVNVKAIGITTLSNTTDSTSSTTGALIISGGVGIAKNVYIGAGLSIAGTLTYEDVTNVDSVGLITAKSGVNVSGGQLQVGVAYSVGAAGVCTAAGFVGPLTGAVTGNADTATTAATVTTAAQTNITSLGSLTGLTVTGDLVLDNGADAGKDITWDVSEDSLILNDDVYLKFGSDSDCRMEHDGSHFTITNTTGNFYIRPKGSENGIVMVPDGQTNLYYDNSLKLGTTNEGIEVTGFTSTTAGLGVTGGLFEGAWIKAGKLTDNLQIGIATANVFYFTTAETTTGTPNIRWNDTYSLSSKMAVGEVASVTVVTTAAAAGYCANWTIDGNAVTEEWVGGSAPSAGGDDGLDIYSFTIIKTGTGTGDSGFKVIANVTNAT